MPDAVSTSADDNAPTPMPGAKTSAPDRATVSRDTSKDKSENTNKTANTLTPDEQKHLDTHVSVLQKLASQATSAQDHAGPISGNKQEESALAALDSGVQSAPGNNASY